MMQPSGLINDEKEKQEVPVPDAILTYHDSTVDANKRWNVTYQGNKYPVQFQDSDFTTKWQQGEVMFGVGFKLKADVVLKQEWEDSTQSFVTKMIQIIDVKDVIPNDFQLGLKFKRD